MSEESLQPEETNGDVNITTPEVSGNLSDLEDLKRQNSFLEDTRRAIFNILEDVSSSEEKLKKKSDELEKFRQAVDTSFDHIVIVDPDGKVLYANHAAELLTGYTREEIVGHTPALWGKQMPEEFYETMWRTIKTEKNKYAGELTNKRKDGTKYLSSLRISPILDETGEISFFVGIERDITEERQSQLRIVRHAAELERANAFIAKEKERAESILRYLKSIGEGVFATDLEGRVIFTNETAELMVGKGVEKGGQHSAHEIFLFVQRGDDGDKSLDITRVTLQEKRTTLFPRDTFLKRADREIPISGTCSLIRDEQHQVIGTITVFQDVTKRHELDQMKDSFLSVAAHQLRTPLGGMRWSMELLLNGDLGRLPKNAKEAIEQIYENSQRMILLVNDLLNVSRIDENKGREEKTLIRVEQVVSDVVRAMQPEADRRGVTIILQKVKTLSLPIMAPAKHFYEAFENILSNSIKYNKQGGTVTIHCEKKKKHVVVIIADTGIGIPEEAQSKIFAKFFRAPNAVLKETEGSGLGLSVVKSYLEEAGAAIRFESQEDVGTTFFVEFPLSE
ncbi:MAG: PAS domain S-box protein [Candidatus Moranbacteria bacterium]|nr:PAS domain S-box protein [Candidatus Moranbacteria bacterium]